MTLTITTWNINSVRLRLPLVLKTLERIQPDILCLQEIKCQNDQFPIDAIASLGYSNILIHGQKGYHGVAICSKLPLSEDHRQDYCNVGDSRHISAIFHWNEKRIRLHNFYVPAGGDEADRQVNPKFGHKLDFIAEMQTLSANAENDTEAVLVGDLNIAPLENDVWSHRQMLKVVSHTPVETDGLLEVMRHGQWIDLMRQHVPPSDKLYTWWSYRAKDWAAADRGRRLDHIWSSAGLASHLSRIDILKEARGWEQPSDHVPVTVQFAP